MLYILLALLALAILTLAVAWLAGGFSRRRLERYVPVGMLSRRYVVWLPIPRKQPGPVPVVLAFHGAGSTVEELEAHAALHTARSAGKFAIVYPEGYHGTWNAGGCCGDALLSDIDDVKFVRALLDDVGGVLGIDRRRIYVTGFCNGAMFCYYLACIMSDEIAAIAPVNGGMFVTECTPQRPVPIFHLHGLADEWVPYHSGEGLGDDVLPPAENGIAFWRTVNGLGSETRERMFGEHADCTIYSAGPGAAPIRVCLFSDVGHHWPGTPARAGLDPADAAALGPPLNRSEVNEAILGFLAGHALPEPQLRRIAIDPATVTRRPRLNA